MSEADKPEGSTSETAPTGYGRPPAEHQFKKGVSGNPRGRPRKRRRPAKKSLVPSVENLVLTEAYRPIQIRENDKLIELPMIQAVLRSLGVAAVKGSHRAQLAITGLVQAIEQRSTDERRMLMQSIMEYKQGWEEVFKQCDRAGKPRPDPVPHPDDLAIDTRTGDVIYNGPFDDGEKAKWDSLVARKADSEEEIATLKKDLKRRPKMKEIYESEIAFEQRLIDMVARTIPDEQTRRAPGFNIHEWRERQAEIQKMRERWRSTKPKT